jgi:hypothetical protein
VNWCTPKARKLHSRRRRKEPTPDVDVADIADVADVADLLI